MLVQPIMHDLIFLNYTIELLELDRLKASFSNTQQWQCR